MISSVDLIEEQIRVARGEKLRHKQVIHKLLGILGGGERGCHVRYIYLLIPVRQEDIVLRGHSIECRINAEDAFKNFRPGPGMSIHCVCCLLEYIFRVLLLPLSFYSFFFLVPLFDHPYSKRVALFY